MDLNKNVTFLGLNLNQPVVSGGVASGCTIEQVDMSAIEVRQFREPRALEDGEDLGPVYKGGRRITITGTVYGTTRTQAFTTIETMNVALYPTKNYITTPASFGFAALTFYDVVDGAQYHLLARSDGLRVQWEKQMFGGNDLDPLAVPWSCTFVVAAPVIV